jgi:transposase
MAKRTLKLGRKDVAKIIDARYAKEPDGWRKRRLLAVKLAAKGQHTSAEVAELCGVARTWLFDWLKRVRTGGLEALLERGQRGPKKGTLRGVDAEVATALKAKLERHELTSAEQARRWLKQEHGVDRPYVTVWNWLKKWDGVLRVPRPSHSKKNPDAAAAFKGSVAEKLEALGLAAGSRVKVWFMDEARFGLHTELRRVWTRRGVRPVVSRQIKYQWDYLYGALGLVQGDTHFAHLCGVGLEFDQAYLRDLAASDPQAIHVLVRDQAGFHLRDKDPRLPARVRIIDLPPYSPELNPCEQLWDVIKDQTSNRIYETIDHLRQALGDALHRFWDDAQAVLSLIGRSWLLDQLNATQKNHLSV